MSNIDYKIRRAVNNGINDYNSQQQRAQQRAQEMHKQRYVDMGILTLVIIMLFFVFTIPYKFAKKFTYSEYQVLGFTDKSLKLKVIYLPIRCLLIFIIAISLWLYLIESGTGHFLVALFAYMFFIFSIMFFGTTIVSILKISDRLTGKWLVASWISIPILIILSSNSLGFLADYLF